jgi:signal transduction histidine kinase
LASSTVAAFETQHFTQASMVKGQHLDGTTKANLISLPHSWNNERPQREGVATYFIDFKLDQTQASESLAVYLPRIGNRYEIYVNDELIHATGPLDDTHTFYTHRGALTKIPKQLVFQGLNLLTIVVAGDGGRSAGLSSIFIGKYEILNKQYEYRYLFQNFTTLIIVIICLFISFLSTLYSYFTKNKYFFMFGLAALFWAINSGYLLLTYFPLNHRILLFFYDFFQAIGGALMCLVIANLIKLRYKWYSKVVYIYIYTSFFSLVFYHDGYTIGRTIFLDSNLALGLISFIVYVKNIKYNKNDFSYITFFCFFLILILLIHDQIFVYHNNSGYEKINFSRYSMLFFIIAIATSLAKQFIKVNLFIQRSQTRMNKKLAIVKSNLVDSFSKRRDIEKKLTLQQERWRLMQDMHDGIGQRLISLQQAVQDPEQTGEALKQMVKQTMTELRTTIQSISQPHENVSYMLGDLRERLDFLCLQYKKELHWFVDEMPTIAKLDDTKIAHIEKIILEIFSNIAKHSSASWVKLNTIYTQGESITITVEENGAGYEGLNTGLKDLKSEQRTASHQRGLLGISRRAADIHARLYFQDKGRLIKLVVPVR